MEIIYKRWTTWDCQSSGSRIPAIIIRLLKTLNPSKQDKSVISFFRPFEDFALLACPPSIGCRYLRHWKHRQLIASLWMMPQKTAASLQDEVLLECKIFLSRCPPTQSTIGFPVDSCLPSESRPNSPHGQSTITNPAHHKIITSIKMQCLVSLL